MQFIFFDAADNRLFVRDDAETADWSVDEMTLTASFPYIAAKEIQRGMRIGFVDDDGILQPFEIRKAKLYEPDHYQEITAEHIAVAELTDEFFQGDDVTDETASTVLTALLTGTQWQVGNSTASNVSSVNIDKGNVWQNVRSVEKNWNVIITPRVTFSATGITGRYLDIAPNVGTWRGVVLSIDSTVDEIGVVWDDSELQTAVYGLGAGVEGQGGTSEPLTFADVVWAATSDHPAKPAGQTYIEDPSAKALYGRNGRNRFGYYQNSDIKDAALLLEKSWEYLKTVNAPTVTIDCILQDLHRMGYAWQPVRLHDTVQVQIRPANKVIVLDVIKLDIDLINPTATRPTIGTYIPNIVYINRETNRHATGGSYRNGGKDNKDNELQEFFTLSSRNEYNIKLEATQRAYEDGQLSTNIGANAAAINISSTRINSVVAGTGVMLNPDGSLVVDSEGHPVFKDENMNMFSQVVQTKAGVTTLVRGISAGDFSASTNYSKNDYVLYKPDGATNSKLYRFTADHPAGAWTGTDVTEVTNLGSTVTQTSEGLTAEVTRATAAEGTLSGRIQLNADKVGLVVEETSGGNVIKAASITAAINATGSQATINADRVNITGTTTIGDTMAYANSNLYVKGDIYAMTPGGSYHALAGNMVVPQNCGLFFSTGSSSNVNVYASDMSNLMASLADVQIVPESGTNNLLLQGKYIGDTTWTTISTFSRAVSKFSGSWNGSGTYSVTADPNGVTSLSITPGLRLTGSGYNSDFSAQMTRDGTFANVEKSVYGYLHQDGGYIGVYTSYSGGTYSGLIARLAVPNISAAEIIGSSVSSVSYNAANKANVTLAVDIGQGGQIPVQWASDSFTQVVDLSSLLNPVRTITLSATDDQQIRPTSGNLGLLGVNVPKINLRASTFSTNGVKPIPTGYDGFGQCTVAVDVSQSVTSNVSSIGTDHGNRTYAGAISKSGLIANSYLGFTISAGGESQQYYITVNP